ncbi:MAG TPA: metallopeptidase family protein [Vulgatibacter sp.]|nr:metallopeptidase family protein [Vulgatibacter sp.]
MHRLVVLLLLASACGPCGGVSSPDAAGVSALPRCLPPAASPLAARSLDALEARALEAEDDGDGALMLACAEEALRLDERHGHAAHLRAAALVLLERWAEAQEAYAVALALEPDDPFVLAGAAELYVSLLPWARSRSIAGVALAERGLAAAAGQEGAGTPLLFRLHLLAAWGLGDLGDFRGALAHARAAVALRPDDRDAQVELGRAHFELTRFQEAAVVLQSWTAQAPDDAEAFHLLGLSLERIPGAEALADEALAIATRLDPEGFPPPVPVDERWVEEAIAALPQPERRLLERARVPVRLEALPALEDLRAEDPPLSPTAVGMFRGPPLGFDAPGPREILLFTRNLSRSSRDAAGVREQVRITLLHELGHLAGESDADLRARGLE